MTGPAPMTPAPAQPALAAAGHVRWLLHPLVPILVACFAVAAVVMLALHPDLLPSYRVLVWGDRAGLVLAVNAAIAWTLILIHELAHLATARAAGVPARITLSTRLQFLAAQTDVSGVWAAPRRTRMTAYLAGMGVDICLAGICLLVLGLAEPHGLVRNLLAVAVTETVLGLSGQFMVFMRTDIYFVLQDLTGCANLYADGSRLSSLSRRAGHPAGSRRPGPQPRLPGAATSRSPPVQRGTAGRDGHLPGHRIRRVLARADRSAGPRGVGNRPQPGRDGRRGVALAILLGFQILWISRWWHRHRPQVRSISQKYLRGERR